MLTTIRQVNEEFFRKFHGHKIYVGGVEKPLLCRYARKSSLDYVEEQDSQIYPCIAIQDYTPVPKKEWYIDMHPYFGGKSLDELTGFLYQRPIWMEFRYDVSIATKSYNEFMAMQDYFMENFVYGKRFIFNSQLSGEDLVGDIVPYEVRETDIPRTDGVFEINYEFTCSVWLYPQKPEEVALVQNIILRLNGSKETTPVHITADDKVVFTEDSVAVGPTSVRLPFTAAEISDLLNNAVTSEDIDYIKKVDENTERTDDRTLYVITEEE